MDKKLSELTFDKDDKLERMKYAENLTNFLLSPENDQKVICVNSSWGTGKTWFVHMFINMLNSEEAYSKAIIPVYYNAWENDDFNNAFVPLIGEINNQLFNKEQTIDKEKIKEAVGAILKDISKNVIKKLTGDIVDIETISEAIKDKKDLYNTFISKYENSKKAKNDFIEAMNSFISKAEKKVFVFIDELDRCRPTFAIETLERIKHYFDINNVCFILLLDKEQLSYSVKTLYGNECDTIGYLMRFIDIEYKLPLISGQKYYNIKINKKNNFERALGQIVEIFNLTLSLRDIDKLLIWSNALLASDSSVSYKLREDLRYLFAYFLILKLKFPETYKKTVNKNQNILYDDFPFASAVDSATFLWSNVHIIKMYFKIMGFHDFPPENEAENEWIKYFKEIVTEVDRKLSFLDYYNIA